jgi:hypothetical protein
MPSNSVLQLYSFDSGYSLVVLGKVGGGIREDQILQFCVIIICRCPQNIIEISPSRKNVHRYVVKNARNVTQFVRQPFYIELQGFVKKN